MEAVRTMATNCDVLLENFRPGVIEKMGLGYEQVSLTNPRLIFGSISGFGRNGARSDEAGFDVTLQALSGVMSINGAPDGDPLRMGVPLGDIGAGMWLALGGRSCTPAGGNWARPTRGYLVAFDIDWNAGQPRAELLDCWSHADSVREYPPSDFSIWRISSERRTDRYCIGCA